MIGLLELNHISYSSEDGVCAVAQLQSGALSCFDQVYVIRFVLLLVVVVVVFLLTWIHHVDLVQLVRVDVFVEVSHDGEDDADAQQQAREQQELLPLGQQITG